MIDNFFFDPECPKPVAVWWIVLGIIGGIILTGIIILIIWKVVVSIKDRREYEKFEQERKNAKWENVSFYTEVLLSIFCLICYDCELSVSQCIVRLSFYDFVLNAVGIF